MKRKVKITIKIISFVLVFTLLLGCVNSLFKPKWLEDRWQSSKTDVSFYELEKNSTDVLFYGSSVMAAAIDPFQLYHEHGISSYNLGVISQTMSGTFFWVKESLKTQKPKVIVVEVKTLGRMSDKLETKARKSYDYMHLGLNKLQYAVETVNSSKYSEDVEETDLWEYLFPLSLYHPRWSELDYDDYNFVLGKNKSETKGYAALADTFRYSSTYDQAADAEGDYDGFDKKVVETSEYNATNKSYVKRIAEFAKENNIELVLLRTPDTTWSVKKYNYVNNIAKEAGVKYLDMNLKSVRDKMGLDFSEDGADSIHMNIIGAKKVTSYLGDYLNKNYKLTNYKNGESAIKAHFESEMDKYHLEIKSSELSMNRNLDNYLEAINDKDYSVILTAGSECGKMNFSENQVKLLKKLNVNTDMLFHESEYGNNITFVSDNLEGDKIINTLVEQDRYTTKTIHEGGRFSDGTSYAVDVAGGVCSVRINNNNCGDVYEDLMNIVVYNKKSKKVVDTVCLKNNSYGSVSIGRKGKG